MAIQLGSQRFSWRNAQHQNQRNVHWNMCLLHHVTFIRCFRSIIRSIIRVAHRFDYLYSVFLQRKGSQTVMVFIFVKQHNDIQTKLFCTAFESQKPHQQHTVTKALPVHRQNATYTKWFLVFNVGSSHSSPRHIDNFFWKKRVWLFFFFCFFLLFFLYIFFCIPFFFCNQN